ncbi:glycosyltransferase [Halosimplex rubrum]|uniref:Glycosyltransferase n=1 Tax=Halosimplex rubrum TaxID=869889 RepID=A0A7D5SWZ6_9EURY|nr:glycosyltransferase [Halosimplex rubrum]QLH76971.1 glycosyltransferase [Halosimplex rubrum]
MSTDPPAADAPNVLQVCTYYYPFTGGIQKLVRTLVTGIDDANFRILTCATGGRGGVDERHGTEVVRAGSPGAVKSTPMSPTFPYRLRQQLAWADLVHYHLPFPLGPVSHLINRVDTPAVATFHDDIVGKGPVVYPYRPVLDRFLGDVSRVIVTSPNMRDECARIAKWRGKAEVVPIGIEAEDGPVEPKSLAGRKLLFVGRLVEFKGVEYLVSAMAELDATLSVVGKGPARDTLERHAREEGVADRVTFEGFVSEARLDRLYREADLFVLPSAGENESFGIVQLEAMQRGLPVINTSLPTGVPYVSVDGETGLTVEPGDPAAIAEAARTLLGDSERYRRYSANAQRRVRERFTRRRMLDETRAVYRDALAGE